MIHAWWPCSYQTRYVDQMLGWCWSQTLHQHQPSIRSTSRAHRDQYMYTCTWITWIKETSRTILRHHLSLMWYNLIQCVTVKYTVWSLQCGSYHKQFVIWVKGPLSESAYAYMSLNALFVRARRIYAFRINYDHEIIFADTCSLQGFFSVCI